MKTKFFALGIVACFSFMSCQQDDLLYSCDAELDAWAKRNYEGIQSFTRAEFISLDYGQQKAAYTAMGEKQRHDIWMGKLNNVLKMDWSNEEAEHIESLISFVGEKESLFANSESQQEQDEFELFMYRWMEEAEENLNWDKATIHAICGDPNEVVMVKTRSGGMQLMTPKFSDYMTAKQSPTVVKTRSESWEGDDCACSSVSDFCDIFGEIPDWVVSCNQNRYKCKITDKGCGLFWQFSCDGICKAPIA